MVEVPVEMLKGIRDAWDEDAERATVLEAAIVAHRQAIGVAYGIGSFKAQAAANRALWALVADGTADVTDDEPTPEVEDGLVRPAMLEDNE